MPLIRLRLDNVNRHGAKLFHFPIVDILHIRAMARGGGIAQRYRRIPNASSEHLQNVLIVQTFGAVGTLENGNAGIARLENQGLQRTAFRFGKLVQTDNVLRHIDLLTLLNGQLILCQAQLCANIISIDNSNLARALITPNVTDSDIGNTCASFAKMPIFDSDHFGIIADGSYIRDIVRVTRRGDSVVKLNMLSL